MTDQKIITCVTPDIDQSITAELCTALPVTIKTVSTVEELFPLVSDTGYYTDFICIGIELLNHRADSLDMFDIIHTLDTLIKSTVRTGCADSTVQHQSTKICVLVDQTTDPQLIKQVMSFPAVVSVGWSLACAEDFQSTLDHVEQLTAGNYVHHNKVIELLKPKKKSAAKNKDKVTLTVRQAQISQIIQERGVSNKVIAKMLNLSESTVKLHVGAILKKYGVRNRTQLALFTGNSK
jgi:DNA-binding NarL/FixJ family response regulator